MGETLTRLRLDRPVRPGSPATNGLACAGYGGLFWRLPPTPEPHVRTAAAAGEHAGSQFAARDPLTVPTGGAATRGMRAPVADGVLDDEAAQTWAKR